MKLTCRDVAVFRERLKILTENHPVPILPFCVNYRCVGISEFSQISFRLLNSTLEFAIRLPRKSKSRGPRLPVDMMWVSDTGT